MLKVILPIATVLLLFSLVFFAFKGGPSDLTGNIVLEDATFISYFELADSSFEILGKDITITNGIVEGKASEVTVRAEAPLWIYGF